MIDVNPEMTMEDVRERLNEIANEIQANDLCNPDRVAAELRCMAERTRRRPVVRRTPAQNAPLNKEKIRTIKYLFQKNPTMPLQAIAVAVGCNIGRVSEVLHGGPRR